MEPSCLLGLANSHLLLECCAEGLEIRFEESDVSAHHAEMGNLLSLNPKIHCLDADAQVRSGFADRERKLFGSECNTAALARPDWLGGGALDSCLFVRHYLSLNQKSTRDT